MAFTGSEKRFVRWYMLEHIRTRLQPGFLRKFSKIIINCNANLDMTQKIQRLRLSLHGKGIWATTKIRRASRAGSPKHLAKAQVWKKNGSGNIPVWRVLGECLLMKHYKLQLVQSITPESASMGLCEGPDLCSQPLPANLEDVEQRITVTLKTVTPNTLQSVWA